MTGLDRKHFVYSSIARATAAAPNLCGADGHWCWDAGNGGIGNQAAREMDLARWSIGKEVMPLSVSSTRGKYVYDDDQETPNIQISTQRNK